MVVKEASVLRVCWWLLLIAKVVTAGVSCLSNPCLHGICIDDINSTYACYCVDGYTGVQCQTNWDECWSAPCLNGGICVDGVAAYNCSCPDGFIGDNCETNFNECESNPCLNNGTCIDLTNGYVCSCLPGYAGDHCEVDVAVCNASEEVRCHNGGQCIEGPGFKFYCKCMPGWAGSKCEDQIDECESNPCHNQGVCIDMHADYLCACPFGYTGKSCEVQIEFCDDNSCSNNALCVLEDGVRVCYCVPDFHGERCELQYDECLLGPRCMNGGTCIDGIDNSTCSCPAGLTGTLCECLVLGNGTYDCNYISPTSDPEVSTSLILTTTATMFTEVTTDLMIFTENGSNDTEARTPSILPDLDTTTYMENKTDIAATTTELTLTTEEPVFTKENDVIDSTDISLVNVSEAASTNTETFTAQPVTSQTIASDDKIEETTITQSTSSSADLETTTEYVETSTQEITSTTLSSTTKEFSEITTFPPTTVISPIPKPESTESTSEHSVISSPKVDETTEYLFTDEPTDQPTLFTTPYHLSTPTTSSGYDNTTWYTTVQSDCSDYICNNQGTCISTPNGIRCHCAFNYRGRLCENKISITSAAFSGNSFISHKLRNTTSISIEFNAKTLNSNGQLMLVNIAKGVYMELFMNFGLLKFKFSCGYQTMLLSELKTFVNKGYAMKIETRLDFFLEDQHCNATLRLNDSLAMSGGQMANVSTFEQNSTLLLGNAPGGKDGEMEPFIGCISDLKVNGLKREVFEDAIEAVDVTECSSLSCLSGPCLNGGTCSDDGVGYVCSCANGWMGSHCKQSVCEHNPCLSGGSCVQHPGSGFLCFCPYGKHGIFCEYNVEITRPSLAPINSGISSYLIYSLSASAANSDRFDLRLRFQTADMDQIALLLFVGQSGRHDSKSPHIALTYVKGYIMLTWNMGAGPRRVFTSRALSYRRGGHSVRVWRRGRSAGFSVDGRYNATGNAPAHEAKMAGLPYIFIGGHPSAGFHLLPHDLPLHNGWRGCVWDIGGQAVGSGKPIGGQGVGQCGVAQCTAKSCNAPKGVCIHSPATYGCICNEGWFGPTCSSSRNPCDAAVTRCKGKCVITSDDEAQCDCPYGKTGVNCDQDLIPTDVLFTGVRSFAVLQPRVLSSISLSLEAEMKPDKERGLVAFAETNHFYAALSMQGGLLEFRWTDRTSGVTSLVRSSIVVSLSQWHTMKAGRYGSRLYVWADGSLSTEAMAAHAYPHTSGNATVVIGGAADLSTLPFDVMSGPPVYYSGCLRNLHINNILLPLEQQNILEGQNLHDCDGTACGAEKCIQGTCVIEAGRARCACGAEGGAGSGAGSGAAGGARCRRHSCDGSCASPRGRCRAGRCVCAAGYIGYTCQHEINITIPQFDGLSVLSLSRKPLRQASPQSLGSKTRGHEFVALNFTTAEPMGLLLWMLMDNDYLGIGLENGILKLIWSLNQNNTDKDLHHQELKNLKTLRSFSGIIPNSGFLADGEWHLLILKINQNNISIMVDKDLIYFENISLDMDWKYDTVDVSIGGVTEFTNSLGRKFFPNNLKGCIDHISTNEGSTVNNYTELYSENLKACQLIPLP